MNEKMASFPVLETERLRLRRFEISDAENVQRLVNDIDIAKSTLNIPHPYTLENAREWISHHMDKFQSRVSIEFAITLKNSHELIGAIGISSICEEHEKAEIGYWIGKKYWGKGYCTEAARRILQFCFEQLKLNRVYAIHFSSNPASGKIMQKIGMKMDGVLRKNIKKWGEFIDTPIYSILRDEYEKMKTTENL